MQACRKDRREASDLLGPRKFEVNYIAQGDLLAYNVTNVKSELARTYQAYYNSFMAHHYPEGTPGCEGHHHKWEIEVTV
jgi:hypothetical protein